MKRFGQFSRRGVFAVALFVVATFGAASATPALGDCVHKPGSDCKAPGAGITLTEFIGEITGGVSGILAHLGLF